MSEVQPFLTFLSNWGIMLAAAGVVVATIGGIVYGAKALSNRGKDKKAE